jgi:PEP-CTERM motif
MRLLLPIVAMLALAAPGANATVLYDGSSFPSAQGWLALAPSGAQTLGSGYVNLNTSASASIQAGYGRVEPTLDSTVGFRLDFTAQLVSEDHGGDLNRAGFSVIVTDQTKHGIEISFWDGAIWVQDFGFVHGHEIEFTTTAAANYSLTVIGSSYSFVAGSGASAKALSGTTVSYDANGLPFPFQDVPYRTANVLFFGDDTTSASASFNLMQVSLAPVPEPSVLATMAAGLAGLAALAFIRRARVLPLPLFRVGRHDTERAGLLSGRPGP